MSNSSQILAHLGIVLDAETAGWGKGLDDARAKMASSGAAINKSLAAIEKNTSSLTGAMKGLATVGAMLWLKKASADALEHASSIAEQAKQAGMATGKFQELEYAQRQNGGSQESWNKGIQFFTNLIGEAAKGTDTAVQALQRVGITQQDLLKQDVGTLYERASDALSKYGDAGRRAAEAQDLFGKAAKESGNAFALSAKELAELGQEARDTGQVLDENVIANAKKAQDELDKFSKKIGNELTQALVQIAPALVKGAELIGNIAEMAAQAARNAGLMASTNAEQEYDTLLMRRVDLLERIARENDSVTSSFNPNLLKKLQNELLEVDTRREELYRKMSAGPKTAQGPGPAAAKIDPIGGAKQGEEFQKLLHDMEKRYSQFQNTLTQDEATQMFARIDISRKEWEFKAEQMHLNLEQRAQFNTELTDLVNAQAMVEDARLQEQRANEIKASLESLDNLRAKYSEEYAIEIERRDALMQLDAAYQQAGLDQDAEYAAIREQIMAEHEARKGDIFAGAEVQRTKVAQMNWQGQLAYAGQSLTSISGLMNTESKKQFEIGKKAAIAQATIAAITSAINSFQSASAIPIVGWILGPIAAAAALVTGMANVAKIKSTQFGGGGGGASFGGTSASMPSVSSSLPDTSSNFAQAPAAPSTAGQRRTINVYLQGSGRYSAAEVRNLIEQINEEQTDGTRVEAVT